MRNAIPKRKKTDMFKVFLPDRLIDHFYELTPDILTSLGIRLLIADIDNTLVPYDEKLPTDEVVRWAAALRDANIALALISNNSKERVELFNSRLGVFAVPKSGKPKKRAVETVTARFGIPKAETALIGDQLFTDILCGRRAGVYTVLTKRISGDESFFIKIKRMLERPIRLILGIK